jgi:hypothetical protein
MNVARSAFASVGLGFAALLTMAALSACTSNPGTDPGPANTGPANTGSAPSTAPASTPATTAAASTPTPVATVTVTATATATAPAAPVTTGYDKAVIQWKDGATASSADEGISWSKAVADLTAGKTTDTHTAGYSTAIAKLVNLISLPDAQQTPTQNAEYHADIDSLNTFFKTPGLYS